MEEEKTDNAFPVQIRHDVDGYFFQPLEYNQEANAWLYGCPAPNCGAKIIISPFYEQEQEPIIEEKPKSKKKKVEINSQPSGEEVPLSQSQLHQPDQQQGLTTEEIPLAVESMQSETETEQS